MPIQRSITGGSTAVRSRLASSTTAANRLQTARIMLAAGSAGPISSARRPPYVAARLAGSFVPGLTRKAFEKHGFSAASLLTDWARIVGATVAAYTAPERLKWPRGVETYGETEAGAEGRPGATLVLRVDPARALDVEYRGRQIMERINAYFGYRAVEELRLLQAPLEAVGAAKPAGLPPLARPLAGPSATAAISDPELKAALERLEAGMMRQKRA